MQNLLGEITRLFFKILNDPDHFLIYDWISYVILSLFLFFIEIYINDIIHVTFFNYIGGSLGGSLSFTLLIRFYYISDDGYFGPMACSNMYFQLLKLSNAFL